MENFEKYLELIVKECINYNKGDSIFVVIPKKNEYLKYHIMAYFESIGVTHYNICNETEMFNENNFQTSLKTNSKMVFFVADNECNQMIELLDDLETIEESPIDYTIIGIPNEGKINKSNIDVLSSMEGNNNFINWRIMSSNVNKRMLQVKNLRIDNIDVTKANGDFISFKLNNEFEGIRKFNKIRMFPNYSFKIFTKEDTVSAFMDATNTTFIGSKPVEDLRLEFKRGVLTDYDCSTNTKLANEYLGRRCLVKMKALGLVDSSSPAYELYRTRNNYVLDRTSIPYMLISSYNIFNGDEKFIYVPIANGSLKIVGFNELGHKNVLYDEEQFSKVMQLNKK